MLSSITEEYIIAFSIASINDILFKKLTNTLQYQNEKFEELLSKNFGDNWSKFMFSNIFYYID
jgi:hypothetical protein